MADLAKLVELKNQQRAALKKEYFKLFTHPNAQGQGHVFDHAVQRHSSMRVTRINHFRETPKNLFTFLGIVVLPLAATIYLIKNDRDKKEALLRSGQVAYKDRLFKYA